MRPYLINEKHVVPAPFVWFLFSVVLSLGVAIVLSAALGLYGALSARGDVNLLELVPNAFFYPLIGWGVYTGVGAVALWIAAWVYWVALERSRPATRILWFLILLIGMHLGALFYALFLWGTDRIKRAPSQGAVGRSTMEGQSA